MKTLLTLLAVLMQVTFGLEFTNKVEAKVIEEMPQVSQEQILKMYKEV